MSMSVKFPPIKYSVPKIGKNTTLTFANASTQTKRPLREIDIINMLDPSTPYVNAARKIENSLNEFLGNHLHIK